MNISNTKSVCNNLTKKDLVNKREHTNISIKPPSNKSINAYDYQPKMHSYNNTVLPKIKDKRKYNQLIINNLSNQTENNFLNINNLQDVQQLPERKILKIVKIKPKKILSTIDCKKNNSISNNISSTFSNVLTESNKGQNLVIQHKENINNETKDFKIHHCSFSSSKQGRKNNINISNLLNIDDIKEIDNSVSNEGNNIEYKVCVSENKNKIDAEKIDMMIMHNDKENLNFNMRYNTANETINKIINLNKNNNLNKENVKSIIKEGDESKYINISEKNDFRLNPKEKGFNKSIYHIKELNKYYNSHYALKNGSNNKKDNKMHNSYNYSLDKNKKNTNENNNMFIVANFKLKIMDKLYFPINCRNDKFKLHNMFKNFNNITKISLYNNNV